MQMITLTRTAPSLTIVAFVFYLVGFVMPYWFARYYDNFGIQAKREFGLWYYISCASFSVLEVTEGCTTVAGILKSTNPEFQAALRLSGGELVINVVVIPILATIVMALCGMALVAVLVVMWHPCGRSYDYKMWVVFASGIQLITVLVASVLVIIAMISLIPFFNGDTLQSVIEFPWCVLSYGIATVCLLISSLMYAFIVRYWRKYKHLYGVTIEYWIDQNKHVVIPDSDGLPFDDDNFGYRRFNSFRGGVADGYPNFGYSAKPEREDRYLNQSRRRFGDSERQRDYGGDSKRHGRYLDGVIPTDYHVDPPNTMVAGNKNPRTAISKRYSSEAELIDNTKTVWDLTRPSRDRKRPDFRTSRQYGQGSGYSFNMGNFSTFQYYKDSSRYTMDDIHVRYAHNRRENLSGYSGSGINQASGYGLYLGDSKYGLRRSRSHESFDPSQKVANQIIIYKGNESQPSRDHVDNTFASDARFSKYNPTNSEAAYYSGKTSTYKYPDDLPKSSGVYPGKPEGLRRSGMTHYRYTRHGGPYSSYDDVNERNYRSEFRRQRYPGSGPVDDFHYDLKRSQSYHTPQSFDNRKEEIHDVPRNTRLTAYGDYGASKLRSSRYNPGTGIERESVGSMEGTVQGGGPDYLYGPSYDAYRRRSWYMY